METKTHHVNTRALAVAHDLTLGALLMVRGLEVIAPTSTALEYNLKAAAEHLEEVSHFLVWARINNRIEEITT